MGSLAGIETTRQRRPINVARLASGEGQVASKLGGERQSTERLARRDRLAFAFGKGLVVFL